VRRCFGGADACPPRGVTEPLPPGAARSARRTQRLRDARQPIGLALGGAATARLAVILRRPTGGQRRDCGHGGLAGRSPTTVGVDECAWRPGRVIPMPCLAIRFGLITKPSRDIEHSRLEPDMDFRLYGRRYALLAVRERDTGRVGRLRADRQMP
jgi:hypothetical protein